MQVGQTRGSARILLFLVSAYGVASLIHFVHNAVYLRDYPNMPLSITATGVYLAWAGIATIGAVGYWLYRKGWRRTGLFVTAIYAAFGFAGLDHYVLAPLTAHSVAMNVTILCEVVAALILFLFAARGLFTRRTYDGVSRAG